MSYDFGFDCHSFLQFQRALEPWEEVNMDMGKLMETLGLRFGAWAEDLIADPSIGDAIPPLPWLASFSSASLSLWNQQSLRFLFAHFCLFIPFFLACSKYGFLYVFFVLGGVKHGFISSYSRSRPQIDRRDWVKLN